MVGLALAPCHGFIYHESHGSALAAGMPHLVRKLCKPSKNALKITNSPPTLRINRSFFCLNTPSSGLSVELQWEAPFFVNSKHWTTRASMEGMLTAGLFFSTFVCSITWWSKVRNAVKGNCLWERNILQKRKQNREIRPNFKALWSHVDD